MAKSDKDMVSIPKFFVASLKVVKKAKDSYVMASSLLDTEPSLTERAAKALAKRKAADSGQPYIVLEAKTVYNPRTELDEIVVK